MIQAGPRGSRLNLTLGSGSLFDFPARLLPVSFAGQGLLDPELLTRLEVEGVTLHFLNNVLLLDLTLEAAKGVFESLALLKFYFRQTANTRRSKPAGVSVFWAVGDRTIE